MREYCERNNMKLARRWKDDFQVECAINKPFIHPSIRGSIQKSFITLLKEIKFIKNLVNKCKPLGFTRKSNFKNKWTIHKLCIKCFFASFLRQSLLFVKWNIKWWTLASWHGPFYQLSWGVSIKINYGDTTLQFHLLSSPIIHWSIQINLQKNNSVHR